MRNLLWLTLCVVMGATSTISADDWPQWRGPNRDGISKETGLLAEWPKEGPKLLWRVNDLGEGYSTPAIVGGRIYVLGNTGTDNEFVQARDVTNGRKIWSVRLGKVGNPMQEPNYAASRSTPTVDGEVLYALGSDGDLVCLEIGTNRERWRKNLRTDFAGKPGMWAYSESPLIDGEALVCTPGGTEATIVALNKRTGALLWKCPLAEEDEANYASAIVVVTEGIRQYVQLLKKGLVGIDAKSGKLLWRFAKPVSIFSANIPTPVAGDGVVYVGSAGTGGGAVRLTARGGGVQADEVYFDAKLPTAIGGAVKIGNNLFGTTAQAIQCIEFPTGKLKWQDRGIGAAALLVADGRLYLHGENGDVALVDPAGEAIREGRFTPPDPPVRTNAMEKPWAYPVVANGRLYIRDGNALWSYDVRGSGAAK